MAFDFGEARVAPLEGDLVPDREFDHLAPEVARLDGLLAGDVAADDPAVRGLHLEVDVLADVDLLACGVDVDHLEPGDELPGLLEAVLLGGLPVVPFDVGMEDGPGIPGVLEDIVRTHDALQLRPELEEALAEMLPVVALPLRLHLSHEISPSSRGRRTGARAREYAPGPGALRRGLASTRSRTSRSLRPSRGATRPRRRRI